MTIKHVYCIFDGVRYFDYTLHSPFRLRSKSEDCLPSSYLIDYNVRALLSRPGESFGFPAIRIPRGTTVYVAPDCPTPMANIRASYTVKKNPDDGDYNVIHPYVRNAIWSAVFDNFAIFPSSKTIVATQTSRCDDTENRKLLYETAKAFIPDADENEMIVYVTYKRLMCPNDSKGLYRRLLDGSFKKPCVTVDALDIACNALTTDMLRLIYFAGKQGYSKENESNLALQLAALGQTDWKKYAGTMDMLKTILRGDLLFRYVENHKSSYPKAVKEILYYTSSGYCGCDDIKMARALLTELMGLRHGVMCVSASDLYNKLAAFNLNVATFQSLFPCKVRIDNYGYDED